MPGIPGGDAAAVLTRVLEEARDLGFLGPGPIGPQVRHSDGFVAALERVPPPSGAGISRVLDLGSGGGVPGLVVADRLADAHVLLVESHGRRAEFLRQAVERCGLGGRVEVLEERAETVGRAPEWRGTLDAVLARSFGPPAVVAECAAPLLAPGGVVVVSEPPDDRRETAQGQVSERWPAPRLAELGLEIVGTERGEFGYQVLRMTGVCPDRYPRRVGVPAKRPLF